MQTRARWFCASLYPALAVMGCGQAPTLADGGSDASNPTADAPGRDAGNAVDSTAADDSTPAHDGAANDAARPMSDASTAGNDSRPDTDNGDVESMGYDVPVVVGACDNLGATGAWQDITPAAFRAMSNLETTAVAVDPQHAGVVYASAGNRTNGGSGSVGVYKSTDCGSTWAKISVDGSPLETGDVWQLFVDATTPRTLYASNGYGSNPTLYKSTDGAVTWNAMPINFEGGVQIRSASMDPTNPLHLVVCMHAACSDLPSNPLCLSETQDGGASWNIIQGPPIPASDLDADGGGPLLVDGTSMFYLHPSDGVWYTNDDGATWVQHFQWYNYPANTAPNSYNPALPMTYAGTGGGYVGSHGLYISFLETGIFEIASPYPTSALAPSDWQLLAGSPSGTAITDDGVNLFATSLNDTSTQPYYVAPVAAGTPWQHMGAAGGGRGGNSLSTDTAHHVVYSANWGGGLWRVVSY